MIKRAKVTRVACNIYLEPVRVPSTFQSHQSSIGVAALRLMLTRADDQQPADGRGPPDFLKGMIPGLNHGAVDVAYLSQMLKICERSTSRVD